MSNTPLLSLPEISESQSGKYITHNEGLNLLEAIVTRVLSRTNGGPPGSPSEGDTYIVDSVAGDWSIASVNDIAHYFGGGWNFITPVQGLSIYSVSDSGRVRYTGSIWELDPAHKVDFTPSIVAGEFIGEYEEVTVSENSYGFGAALRFNISGECVECDKDSASTMPCSVVALESGTGTKKVLYRGKVKSSSWNFTSVGQSVYVGDSGGFTSTRPSASGDQVQVAGIARASGELIFNPSYVVVEIA